MGEKRQWTFEGPPEIGMDGHLIDGPRLEPGERVVVAPVEDIAEEILEAQADLQSALGRYRLKHGDDSISDTFYRSLARTHRLLAAMGRPMGEPATHPDIDPEVSVSGGRGPEGRD